MRVGAAAKFGNRTSRIFFLQGEQGFTSSLALILPHRVWDYPLRPRPAAYPVLNTALERWNIACTTALSLPFMVVYGTPW